MHSLVTSSLRLIYLISRANHSLEMSEIPIRNLVRPSQNFPLKNEKSRMLNVEVIVPDE